MTSSLPLIRLSAANPFLLELRSRKLDARGLLREMDLPEKIPASDELFVSSQMMYQIVEKSAEIAGDPHIGFTIGQKIDLQDWNPIALAATRADTVGDLLNHFIVNASDHSSSTEFFLRTTVDRTTFGFCRLVEPVVVPAQNDAFYLGLIIKMLMQAVAVHWAPATVFFKVADPDAVPSFPEGIRIAKGDKRGAQGSFPSTWLLGPFEKSAYRGGRPRKKDRQPPDSLVEALHLALLPHMHEPDLNVERAAEICGYSRRRLSRQLRSKGTTLGKEIATLRAKHAQHGLINSDRRVFEIAQSVGFKDPTVFSRAFKNWTGQSPQEYRRTHR